MLLKIYSKAIFLLLCLLFTSLLFAKTISTKLDNGLHVVIKEDNRAPAVFVQLWYYVGSQDEQVGKTGLSHALEHMMFKGTNNTPAGEFSKKISAWGGSNNAYTTNEVTVYHESVAAQYLPNVLAMEADRMQNLNFSDDDFKNEMSVIKEERRMRSEDSPQGKLWEKTNLTVFKQPFNQAPVIGYEKDLNQFSADDLRQWYHSWYAPNNATLIIVGDINAQKALATVTDLFGSIKPKELPARAKNLEPTAQWGARAQVEAQSDLPMVNIVYSAPKLVQLDDTLPFSLSILDAVLSGNDSARIPANIVRNQQKALAANSNYDLMTRSANLFMISAYPSKGIKVDTLVSSLENQIALIAKKGVSKQELNRVRKQVLASRVYARDIMSTQASIIGALHNIGLDFTDENTIQKKLLAVSVKEVQEAAQFLMAQKPAVIVLYPDNNHNLH